MTRKMIGFGLFVSTGYLMLITNILRQELILDVIVSLVILVLAGIGLKGHFEELKG